jgi:hypothetical protein
VELQGLDLFLWALGLIVHCVLLGVLLVRHRATHFPVFTTLIAVNIVRTAVLYFTYRFGSRDAYFYTYWALAFLDVTLMVAVIYELSSRIFRPLGPWAPEVKRKFALFVAGSLAVACLLTWLATPPTQTLRKAIVIRGNFFTSAVMSELFVVMLVLSVTMGFPWRTHVARITQGFGVYAIFCVLADSAHSYFGSDKSGDTYTLVSHIRISLYCLCVVYWIVELARNEPEPRKLPEELRLELRALQSRVATVLQGFREVGRA